ncbi:MAG: type III pantothenate kinase [Lentisphaerae bacterium]|nr:type III pantothenate kinase [Lentisphaerota bacterium]
MSRCLLVDVGNTNTGMALYVNGRMARQTCIATEPRKVSAAVLRKLAGRTMADGGIVSSVVPGMASRWVSLLAGLSAGRPMVLDASLELNVKLDYPRPGTLGPDRIADACGAYLLARGPVVVVDVGTAATVDAVTVDGRFVGGAIAPGPAMMTRALAEGTALLPNVKWGGPCGAVGRSTVSAIRTGVRIGYRGMIDALIESARSVAGRGAAVVATGGWAARVFGANPAGVEIRPWLTFDGMVHIWELNR